MIKLSKLNGKEFILNSDRIECVSSTPDTVITTIEGKVFVVKEDVDTVVNKVIEFRGKINDFKVNKGGV